MKRSSFAWPGPVTLVLLLWAVPGTAARLNVNFKALVSRADLDYNEPARRSDEGMPVGNGRMGSLVWTSATQLKFQINRVDVFAADGRTVSFPEADSDFVESNYTYFIYLMGATSRADYPPHFNGMLWRTTGDMSRWGSQYWSANTLAYYSNLMPANRLDLMGPLYRMYFNMKDACAQAARQQWDSQGIWIPEISWFNGPEPLPQNLIQEFQDLFLVRKMYEKRSNEFQWYVETKTRRDRRRAHRWTVHGNPSDDAGKLSRVHHQ